MMPLAALAWWQVRRGAWETVDASVPRERPALFAVAATGLLALLAYLVHTQPGTPLIAGTAGVLAVVAVCAAVTPWVKVSLHMTAAAFAAAVLLRRGQPAGWLLAAGLPLLAWSRVALGRHRWREVALGLAIGAGAGVLTACTAAGGSSAWRVGA
jgi:membrane-associated phospholipid phosphatase